MSDDEALETLFAMANVQDVYAKKTTDLGLKVIHKANAKAQRKVATAIKDLRSRLASAEVERDRLRAKDEAAQKLAEALAPVGGLHSWTESAADSEIVIMSVGTVRKMRAALAAYALTQKEAGK